MTVSSISFTETFRTVKAASRSLAMLSERTINEVLLELADKITQEIPFLLKENKKDLDRMDSSDPKYDRLQLTEQRIQDIAKDIRNVTQLPTPLQKILEERTMPNGLQIQKVTVPLGVIGIIYEARPNVTLDVFSLCLKSGNACILKGGSDASYSNEAIVQIIRSLLKNKNINQDIIYLLPPDREATAALLNAVGFVDIVIPRGSQQLIDYVRQHARVPVIETGAGIVHLYLDESGDIQKAADVILNSKTRRVSVCNALDCLLVHSALLKKLPDVLKDLAGKQVIIYADKQAYHALKDTYPQNLLQEAEEAHFGMEFLDYKISVKTVQCIDEAIDHINLHSSRHSEAIISESAANMERFQNEVDAAVIYLNASTAFTDGAQYGLGAEIGISTQKLHARGPMALKELTSYKWIVRGNGQVRK